MLRDTLFSTSKHKTALLLEYTDYIYKCAFRYCGNQMDAEDITQETYYLAYKKFKQLKDVSKIKSWLFSILRNLYITEFNKNQKYNYIGIEDYIEKLPEKNIESEFEFEFSNNELQEALNLLEEKYKTPVLLFYFSEHSYKEISEMLNIPIGTVMSRISRSKIFLRGYLTQKGVGIKYQDNIIKFKKEVL